MRMIDQNSSTRISIAGIMSHPWYILDDLPTPGEVSFEANRVRNLVNAVIDAWKISAPVGFIYADEANIMRGAHKGAGGPGEDSDDEDTAREDYEDEDLR